jgi:hypothetical protein
MSEQALSARDVTPSVDELTVLARRLRIVRDDESVPADVLDLLRRQFIDTHQAMRLRAGGAPSITARN